MIKAFISHSSKDKRFVRTLKEDLNENGIETWFDEDQLDLGDSLLEKLDSSLTESTHFIIILSPNSIKSDWVKFELNKAIIQVTDKLMHKIIPIKYRVCDIPTEISGLLYADLSKEIVRVNNNKIEFTTEGYAPFLNKLVKTLNTPSNKKLSNQDKIMLKEEFRLNESSIEKNRDFIATLTLQVEAYSTAKSRDEFINKIAAKSKKQLNEIKPIILPRIIQNVFKNIQLGDQLKISFNSKIFEIGHFGGFRRDDVKITVDPDVRYETGISRRKRYTVRFDASDKSINFITEE